MSRYGDSMVLDEKLDLVINDQGDIKCTTEEPNDSEDLEKDLAYMTIAALDQLTGSPAIQTTEETIKQTVRETINKDARVEKILDIQVTEKTSATGAPLDEFGVDVELQDNISSRQELEVTI